MLRSLIDTARALVDAAADNVRIAARHYADGTLTIDDLIGAFDAYHAANRELIALEQLRPATPATRAYVLRVRGEA